MSTGERDDPKTGARSGKRSGKRDRDGDGGDRLKRRDIWKLIGATYLSSLPYLLIFLAGLLLATWIFTELVF